MQLAVMIIDATRTPMGPAKPGSLFADVRPAASLLQSRAGLIERHRLDPGLMDDVIAGRVSQGPIGDMLSSHIGPRVGRRQGDVVRYSKATEVCRRQSANS